MNLVNNKAADAAPELLECLKNLLFYHYHETEMPTKGTRDREVYDAAVAAIARATAVRRPPTAYATAYATKLDEKIIIGIND
jgi:hypothetical protein